MLERSCHIERMTEKHPRRPRDPNQLAKRIIEIATGEVEDTDSRASEPDPSKNPHAVELGRLGGKKGGAARAKALSPEKRSEIAKRAAAKRWHRE
jgi:hypothetical protein